MSLLEFYLIFVLMMFWLNFWCIWLDSRLISSPWYHYWNITENEIFHYWKEGKITENEPPDYWLGLHWVGMSAYSSYCLISVQWISSWEGTCSFLKALFSRKYEWRVRSSNISKSLLMKHYQLISCEKNWLFMKYKAIQRKWQNTDKIWEKYIKFRNLKLNNSCCVQDISTAQTPFSDIFKELSNDTKYMGVGPTQKWLFTKKFNFFLKLWSYLRFQKGRRADP